MLGGKASGVGDGNAETLNGIRVIDWNSEIAASWAPNPRQAKRELHI